MQAREIVKAGPAIRDGFVSLFRPPFRILLLVAAIVTLTSARIGVDRGALDQTSLAVSLGLFAVSVYIDIAVTLAAGRFEPDPSADVWIKAAWRRRVFWRYLLTSVIAVAALLIGIFFVVVGLFVVGAFVALSGPAVVLERHGPVPALIRSTQLGKGSRVPVGIVFAVLFLLPTVGIQLAFLAELDRTFGAPLIAITVAAQVLRLAGLIAVTRLFVQLGGSPTPTLQNIGPPPRAEVPPPS